jgi:hypothetical protein
MTTTGKVESIQPIIGTRTEKSKKVIEYERLTVAFDGELTGYAVINNFDPGKLKIGDPVELSIKGAGQ